MNKKAFSFVEMIIAVAIIVLLASIGISYKSSYDDNKFNAKIQADLASLNNAFLSYKQENNSLPIAKSNNNFFKSDSSYAHNENDDAFWVHGFVTDDLISKKYIDSLPLEPRTNQFYAYWKTLSPEKLQFEFAGIVKNDWIYQTIVSGNYDWKELVGLIREYNWPQFLYNKATQNFPYNPEERLMTAKIGSYSGSVEIIKNWNTINSNILSQTLNKWDTIKVNWDWFANIYFSDGSRSTLESNSELVLDNMEYKSENNLLTKVKLLLSQGSIWTKATSLNPDWSEFEITNNDATAAVRWTIFKVEKNWDTKIIVKKWKVWVKNESSSEIEVLENQEVTITSTNISTPTNTTESFTDNEVILPSNIKPEIIKIENNKVIIKQAKEWYYIKDSNDNRWECNENKECDTSYINTNEIKLCTKIGWIKENCSKEIKISTNLTYNSYTNTNNSTNENIIEEQHSWTWKIEDLENILKIEIDPNSIAIWTIIDWYLKIYYDSTNNEYELQNWNNNTLLTANSIEDLKSNMMSIVYEYKKILVKTINDTITIDLEEDTDELIIWCNEDNESVIENIEYTITKNWNTNNDNDNYNDNDDNDDNDDGLCPGYGYGPGPCSNFD